MRNDLELLRIISAFGIVWFHSGNNLGREVSYSGLMFFAIVSAYLAVISQRSQPAKKRFARLMIPCLIWSVLYGLLNYLGRGNICWESYRLFSCVLATPSTHLWYLPYMCALLILIEQLKQIFSQQHIGFVAGFIGILLMLLAPYWRMIELIPPLDSYLRVLPAVLAGIFLGCYYQMKAKLRIVTLLGLVFSIVLMSFVLPNGVGIPYLLGILPSLVVLKSDLLKEDRFNIYRLSSLMFGVYLIHFFFMLIFWKIGFDNYSLSLVVFLLSVISIYILQKILPKRIYKYIA